jgi:hypothetical protein
MSGRATSLGDPMVRTMRTLKLTLVLCAALGLGACNLVMSQTPMFTTADAVHAPGLRPGVWTSPDAKCDFKTSDPVDKWPSCANAGLIDAEAIRPTPGSQAAAQQQIDKVPYVLAAGDPRVMQVEIKLVLVKDAPATTFFYYVALTPTAFDQDGRIVAAQLWPIQCGPPPPQPKTTDQNTDPADMVTKRPLPGMKVDKGVCTPADKAAILGAARPSRAWADSVGTLKWVKDAP